MSVIIGLYAYVGNYLFPHVVNRQSLRLCRADKFHVRIVAVLKRAAGHTFPAGVLSAAFAKKGLGEGRGQQFFAASLSAAYYIGVGDHGVFYGALHAFYYPFVSDYMSEIRHSLSSALSVRLTLLVKGREGRL